MRGGGPDESPPLDASAAVASAPVMSVAKAALVLKAFAPSIAVLSVRQIALRTGIPRSTVHALCRTLTDTGLLDTAAGGYRLGPVLVELGGQVIERTGLVRAAEGLLAGLIRSPEEEVHLGQLSQSWIVYLDRETGPRRPAMLNRVGQRAPAHITGCGKAALSLLPFDEVEQRVRRHCAAERRPLPDLVSLQRELRVGRAQGFVVSRSFQRGRTSVAAPLLDAAMRPIGGVSVAGPATAFTAVVLAAAQTSVVEAARLISARLVSHAL